LLSWKIAEAKAMKNHKKAKKPKKWVQCPCFSCNLETCLCCNKWEKIEKRKKKGEMYLLLMYCDVFACLGMTLALQHGKYKKPKKGDVYMLEYQN
jgi:hypothetical protein